jgi:hypothetical protein
MRLEWIRLGARGGQVAAEAHEKTAMSRSALGHWKVASKVPVGAP